MVLVYSPRCLEYAAPGHPERPDRIRSIVARLQNPAHRWVEPEPCHEHDIVRVHGKSQLLAVRTGHYEDADTPFFSGIFELARLAAGGAIVAAEQAMAGRRAFSVMRPPGHHAERDRVMGFCYFNNIAIAVAKMIEERHLRRVAILDFDCHHGNGTEDIFLGDSRVRFVSLHQAPCYPSTGLAHRKNCFNFPLPPGTGPAEFLTAYRQAVELVRSFEPQLVAVSAGFDALQGDPITQMGLEVDTYREIGAGLSGWSVPTFAVLEGGYADELAACVAAFIAGWEGP